MRRRKVFPYSQYLYVPQGSILKTNKMLWHVSFRRLPSWPEVRPSSVRILSEKRNFCTPKCLCGTRVLNRCHQMMHYWVSDPLSSSFHEFTDFLRCSIKSFFSNGTQSFWKQSHHFTTTEKHCTKNQFPKCVRIFRSHYTERERHWLQARPPPLPADQRYAAEQSRAIKFHLDASRSEKQ